MPDIDASPSAGTKLYMGTTALAGLTDTYVEVMGIESIPEFGRAYNEVTFTPLASRGVQKYKGSFNDGSVTVPLAKNLSDEGQAALLAGLATDFDYNFKVEANDKVAPVAATVTIAPGTPGVVTHAAHGFVDGTAVKFTTTGSLPGALVSGTTYYVVDADADPDEYSVAATKGGAALTIAASPAGSGVHTVTTVPSNSVIYFKAKVMSFTNNPGNVDAVLMSGVNLGIKSGTLSEVARLPGPAVA